MKMRHKKMARCAYRAQRWEMGELEDGSFGWIVPPSWPIVRWEAQFRSVR